MIGNGVALKFVSGNPNPLFQAQFLNKKKTHLETGRPLRTRIRAERVAEIRVCVNRTCRRQGSFETLEVLSGVSPPNITVKSCGCLGRCGAGPNLVVLPTGVFVGHCGTAAKAAQVLMDFCGLSTSEEASNCLAALALRKKAEEEFLKGNFSDSELLLTQAIDLKPFGGIHMLHKNRSSARLAMNNIPGALEDAKEALQLAPHYTEAYICQGDAFMDMDQFDSAEKSYAKALEIDPSVRRSKSFKARIGKLQEKLVA